jgi:hypothetical protein
MQCRGFYGLTGRGQVGRFKRARPHGDLRSESDAMSFTHLHLQHHIICALGSRSVFASIFLLRSSDRRTAEQRKEHEPNGGNKHGGVPRGHLPGGGGDISPALEGSEPKPESESESDFSSREQ